MERKIGEIFEYNGEWYQCVEGNDCANCVFIDYCKSHSKEERDSAIGLCVSFDRNDGMHVIFKKLEKVGEPYAYTSTTDKIYNVLMQQYKVYYDEILPLVIGHFFILNPQTNAIAIEIKQNKEDMEEKNNAKHSNSGSIGKNLRPFDLEAAKAGKPVCTRDGRKARIICFDRDWDMHIVALVSDPLGESVHYYLSNGKVDFYKQNDEDLMMLPEKKEGWVNVYKDLVYDTKEEALAGRSESRIYIDTIKISWEE